MSADYEDRLLRVVAHIHANPAGDLSLDALAGVAAMSRFHWHRVWREMTGETLAQSVRRIRLHLAACRLQREGAATAEVARAVGYPDVDSFSRAFSAQYGMTPAQFRRAGPPRRPPPPPMIRNLERRPDPMFDVTLCTSPGHRLAGLPHRGSYFRISEAYSRLDVMIAARGLRAQMGDMYAVFFDDVTSVPEAELRSFAAFEIAADATVPEGMEGHVLPAGEEAVLLYRGPYAGLPEAYGHLFGTWLPASGREPADAPSYERYLNTPLDTAPDALLTELHLPLRAG